jgi:hypothetical protein
MPSEFFKSLGLAYHTGSIVGNVAGDNWVKKLWKEQTDSNFPLVEATTFDNAENLPKDFIDGLEILKIKKPTIYNRFVMNDWSAEVEGRVFNNIENCIAGENVEPQAQFQYSLGLDLAKSVDFNVICVLNRQTRHVDYFERWNGTSWNLTEERVKAVALKYNNALAVPDSTGVGDPIVEALQRAGVGIYYAHKDNSEVVTPGIKFNSINKENMIEKLKVAIEQRLITFPNHEVLIQELRDFEVQMLPSRSYRYCAPEGKHDDCVIALALALWGIEGGMYAPEYKELKPLTRGEEFWRTVKQDRERYNQNAQGEEATREIASEDAARI